MHAVESQNGSLPETHRNLLKPMKSGINKSPDSAMRRCQDHQQLVASKHEGVMSEHINQCAARVTIRAEFVVAALISFLAVVLHVVFLTHAGGLWRDESGGVGLATVPGFVEMCRWLTHDSFPGLFPMVLRGWSFIGFGSSDFGLRVLGLLIGFSLLGVFWWNARVFGCRTPLISLGLLAVNPAVIRWGDSLRAYGLGCILTLLFVGCVWRLIQSTTIWRYVFTSLIGLLSVQCLYQNAFLVGATCVGASVVCLRRGRIRSAWVALASGLPAAISLIPYVRPLKNSQQWWVVEKTGFKADIVWGTLSEAIGTPLILGPVIWIFLLLGTCVVGFAALEKHVSRRTDISADLPLFGGIAATGGVIGFFVFVASAGLPTQPWYWLPLMTFVVVCAEGAFRQLLPRLGRWALAIVGTIVFLSLLTAWNEVKCRMTNIDQLADHVRKNGSPNDLIIVYPWYCGVSFNRHYKGQTPWVTVPELEDHRFHRYDLLKVRLGGVEKIRPMLDRIKRTLSSGNKVWFVGGFPSPLPQEPGEPTGWYDEPYNYYWGRQMAEYVQTIAGSLDLVSLPTGNYTRYENLPLFVAVGFRGSSF